VLESELTLVLGTYVISMPKKDRMALLRRSTCLKRFKTAQDPKLVDIFLIILHENHMTLTIARLPCSVSDIFAMLALQEHPNNSRMENF
jgi:hypothetical protein